MVEMKIAVIENDQVDEKHLERLIAQWNEERGRPCELCIHHYRTGEAFLADRFMPQMIFLDIELGSGISGMETAVRLRCEEVKTPIVFLTGYETYVYAGYRVRAMDYILKPGKPEDIYRCLDKLSAAESTLLILKYFEERSFRAISGILCMPENTVKTKTYRLLRKIREEEAYGN